MKKNKIVACLDVSGGMLVKGVKFDEIVSIKDPVEAGLKYAENGIDELVYYDISATVEDRGIFEKPIIELSKRIGIPFTVGGGIKNLEDIERVLKLGADKVSINSAAVSNPELISQAASKFGSKKIVGSMDVKKSGDSWVVYLGAGKVETGIDAVEWAIKLEELGAGELCINSIDNDGVKTGFDLELVKKISSSVKIPTVASGGAGEYQHFIDAYEAGAVSALGASVFHFGILDIGTLKEKITEYTLGKLKFDSLGLIPAIVQDALSKKVLMQAYMNRESLAKTIETGSSWFYSRSRQELWEKGATSGNTQRVVSLSADCDYDSLLMEVLPDGPACHTGEVSCYYNEIVKFTDSVDRNVLFEEFDLIKDRVVNPKPGAYTDYLLSEGVDKICKKIGEEAAETIIAAKNNSREELIYEAADLLYHLNVLLVDRGIELDDIMREIMKRGSKSY
ncbi:bifunctional phosphoribosyl-AMP cyclohydrolase/phosphoribosyl-ATP diphosphatase HisIE [Microaceticoccus formicicus]|uniref:bifunctional phosphoribosyl-AMP cyclohydrolase/phosphoribosyl-ATP diphosphatase HisIE n=1 Tax=Microaceticoccus formicicus TaxID=3118105 RepID=UPI003CD048E7|nr:bifunctional phosphoribosyl-AMP cyclohydrolase/phosphoribosyl-ATP diphosphatase HisIE [Peptoniphilaceae bacterium AMB_02]